MHFRLPKMKPKLKIDCIFQSTLDNFLQFLPSKNKGTNHPEVKKNLCVLPFTVERLLYFY